MGRRSCHSSGRSHHHPIRALQMKSPTANSKLVPSQPPLAVANVRGIRTVLKRAKICSSFPLSTSTQSVSSVGLYGRGCLSRSTGELIAWLSRSIRQQDRYNRVWAPSFRETTLITSQLTGFSNDGRIRNWHIGTER